MQIWERNVKMKKVLIISSSPRKGGNSDTLCDQFMKGAIESGNHAEKIFLKDKKINYCCGCGACNAKKGICSQKDDMSGMLEKMMAADVIVMATPVYFYTMCGQMKTFIDRVCAAYTKIINKEFYFILTAADTDKDLMASTVAEFRGFTYCLDGAIEKDIIYGLGAWKIGDIKKNVAFSQAYEIGKKV